ncbi:hypothetical protein [Rhizobium leguminosarum]|uniref:hypothetical protein n=1 Tax=Rhizobium leguminosarum TaxID=384 RepID=UPI003F99C489
MDKTRNLILLASLLGLANSASAACTVPNQIENGGVIDGMAIMGNFNAVATCLDGAAPAGPQNSIQLDNGGGGFAAVGPLSDGQLLIGATGTAPSAATLTAGSGIAITNSPGAISLSTTGVLGGGGADWLNGTAVVKPTAASFTLQTSTTPPTGAAISSSSRGVVLSASAAVNGAAMMAEMNVPSGHWQATMLAVYTGGLSDFSMPSIAVRDAVNNRAVEFGVTAYGLGGYRFDYFITSGGVGLNSRVNDITTLDVGFPQPAQPIWQRLTYDGTNLVWSFSRDGEFFIPAYSVSATAAITNLSKIGPAVLFAPDIRQTWSASFHVLSWNVVNL